MLFEMIFMELTVENVAKEVLKTLNKPEDYHETAKKLCRKFNYTSRNLGWFLNRTPLFSQIKIVKIKGCVGKMICLRGQEEDARKIIIENSNSMPLYIVYKAALKKGKKTSEKLREVLEKSPYMSAAEAAKKAGISEQYVYQHPLWKKYRDGRKL